ncbi:hypothetical protein [Acidithiobacillus sp. IBUN Pt1247-S3]|uniref:hypothetical protein n=1 Tax=Acidithiobacillus sp. IBUN Pt1247-S3 TaxID=3166642 RepID=UPI0034E3E45A
MCLLDEVQDWGPDTLSAVSRRYQQADNPLRRGDATLGTASLIEIAAQAMALHGALTALTGDGPVPGYLVSLRDVHIVTSVLTDDIRPLQIEIRRHEGSEASARYSFIVSTATRSWLRGLAVVIFGDLP